MSAATNRIRIGVLGCAGIARRSFIPALLRIPEFELVAVASRDTAKAAETAQAFGCRPVTGYAGLVDDPAVDAMYVPLPSGLHREWVTRALDAGKHVIAEKSLGLRLQDVEAMVASARRRGLVLMEDFMYRYHSQHRRVFDWMAEIGELRLFRADFGFPPLPAGNFRDDAALGGGVVIDAAGYTVDASRWFLGDDLDVAAATLFVAGPDAVPRHGSAMLRHAVSGVTAQVAFGFDNHYRCQYELWGSKGYIVARRAFTPRATYEPVVELHRGGERQVRTLPADDHFVNIAREFARRIVANAAETDYAGLLAQSRLLDTIHRTAVRVSG